MDSGTTSKEYIIRRGTEQDIPSLLKLSREQFDREHLSEIGHTYNMLTSMIAWKFSISHPQRDVFVADANGELVGYILSIIDSTPYDLTMQVSNECGLCTKTGWERKGIGFSLIAATEKAALERGVRHMSLGAPYIDWNEKKQASYAKRGYYPAEVICYKYVQG